MVDVPIKDGCLSVDFSLFSCDVTGCCLSNYRAKLDWFAKCHALFGP
ncbi:uncharacterized protein J3R85_007250 [Psidium guajava]|nr:uncharacterized protein J3R85_007250 [Psidium guajava]